MGEQNFGLRWTLGLSLATMMCLAVQYFKRVMPDSYRSIVIILSTSGAFYSRYNFGPSVIDITNVILQKKSLKILFQE